MMNNKKLRNLLLALLATVTCGTVMACGGDEQTASSVPESSSTLDASTSSDVTSDKNSEVSSDATSDSDSTSQGGAGNSSDNSEEQVTKYTVQFVNYDGNVLQSGEVEEGVLPVYAGTEPTKAADAQYTYTFSGWDKQIVEAAEDVTYTAQFDSEINKYDVEFYNGEEIVYLAEQVPYGETPVYAGEELKKYGLGVWEFAGWDKEISAVDGTNLVYSATFNKLYGYKIVAVVDGVVTDTSADYWNGFDETLGLPFAGIQAHETYRFTVEDIDFTEYDTVTLPVAVNYVGMKLTALNGEEIATTPKGDLMKLSVTKDGRVFFGNSYVEGVTMTDGVFSFDITRGSGDIYAALTYGALEFDTFTVPAIKVYQKVADKPIATNTNFTFTDVTATQNPAKGFESSTQIDVASWTNGVGAAIGLNDYSEIKFAIKTADSSKFYSFLCGGTLVGNTEWGNNNTDWLTVSLIKNADKWDVYFNGTLKQAGFTLNGNSLDACNFQFAAATYYVSELKGVKIEKNYTSVADQIFAPSNGTATVAEATAEADLELGISKITTAAITGWGIPTLSDVALGEYSEYKFYIKKGTTGDIYQGGADWQKDWAYQLIADQWAEVVLIKNAEGKYDVTVSGANKQVKELTSISNLNELIISCTKVDDAGILYVSNLLGLVAAE